MPDKLRQDDIDLLRRSPLFDEAYYLANNPDLAAKGVDPVKHYLRRGANQGRDPGPDFSTTGYLRNNQDIKSSGVNPLVHYLRHGKAEGRTANPYAVEAAMVAESGLFDEEYYRHYFPDLPQDENPVIHYLREGAELDLDPSERFSTRVYLAQNPDVATAGSNPLVHYLRFGRAEGRLAYRSRMRRPMFETLYQERWPHLQPLPLVHVPTGEPRVTVLTDSVNAASFFGGVGTALILGMMLANRTGASLRLATRTDAPDGRVVAELEKAHGLKLAGPLELSHIPIDGTRALPVGPGDVVMTTSWWSTRAVLDSTLPRQQVLYLLQEDERMFYPWGDDRLLCQETLAEPDLAVVVNTRRLLDHLTTSGAITVQDATSFEPAFPGIEPSPREPGAKRQLFFYSRPENARNLFWRGGLALSRAIEKRVLDPEVWDFHFAGRSTPELTLPGEVNPHVYEGLPWAEYQALVSRMDAALVLMDTPHPSYPPYDLAAAGAAVLTNSHGSKTDLSDISANILVADPSLDGLAEGLERLAALGQDDEQRRRNLAGDGIARSWDLALGDLVASLVGRFGRVLGGTSDVH
jgi:hypothetical protein